MRQSTVIEREFTTASQNDDAAPSMILELVTAALDSDFSSIRRLGADLVSQVAGDDSPRWRQKLDAVLRGHGPTRARPAELPNDSKSRTALVEQLPWPKEALLMEEEHEAVIRRFVAEAEAAEDLAAAGLATRLNLLLSGPPGTGKTLTAGHIAARLGRPFFVARLDAMISSLLGDTAKNVRGLLDFVQRSGGVLLLDEFDAIAKQRDDVRDVGELKRVVNAMLQALDRLDERCVVIAATNHPQLLDPAVWRRFPYRLDLGFPGADLRRELWDVYLDLDGSKAAAALSRISEGMSCADIREIALAARRGAVISKSPVQLGAVVEAVLSCKNGKFRLPRLDDLPTEVVRNLRKEVADTFKLAAGDIGALFQITREGARKSLKAARQVHKDGVDGAGKSSSAAQGGRQARGRGRTRQT